MKYHPPGTIIRSDRIPPEKVELVGVETNIRGPRIAIGFFIGKIPAQVIEKVVK